MGLRSLKRKVKKALKYNWEHKKAFLELEKALLGKNTFRGYLHDSDKLLLSVLLAGDQEKITHVHRKLVKHHGGVLGVPETRTDLIEKVIDWECSRMTKPVKNVGGLETVRKYHPGRATEFLRVMEELGLIEPACGKKLEIKPKSVNLPPPANPVGAPPRSYCPAVDQMRFDILGRRAS